MDWLLHSAGVRHCAKTTKVSIVDRRPTGDVIVDADSERRVTGMYGCSALQVETMCACYNIPFVAMEKSAARKCNETFGQMSADGVC